MNHRPGATLSAGSLTVLPTVRFSPATTVEFIAAANNLEDRSIGEVIKQFEVTREPVSRKARVFPALPVLASATT